MSWRRARLSGWAARRKHTRMSKTWFVTGAARGRWAHLDMSAPSWIETNEGELVKGATGWGVRTLLRWLESVGEQS